jgi:hypothetical protein
MTVSDPSHHFPFFGSFVDLKTPFCALLCAVRHTTTATHIAIAAQCQVKHNVACRLGTAAENNGNNNCRGSMAHLLSEKSYDYDL